MFYAVRKGIIPGIYATWDECQKQTLGFKGAEYKKFANKEDAEAFMGGTNFPSKNSNKPEKTAFYAVKVGKTPGIYFTWSECQSQIEGVSGSKYKKFTTMEDAQDFMNGIDQNEKLMASLTDVYAFVDGSFNETTKTYGYGGYVVDHGEKILLQGSGNDEDMASMRNVAGEVLGSTAALQYAIDHNIKEITILYDYEGIEKFANGVYQPGQKGTIAYRDMVLKAREHMNIKFIHTTGHTGIDGNEEADVLAKEAVGIFH